MIEQLENIPKIRVRLTVPLIASYLSKNYRITDIAKICNQSHQWVSEFMQKHYDKLLPLIDDKDVYSAMQAKYISNRAKDELENVLNTCNDFNKKDLIPLTAVSDRHTQQYRLLSDRSTSSVSVSVVDSNIKECDQAIIEAEARLDKLTGNTTEE
jgi:hypothetical protein